ncbi:HNH endonuclease [Ancylobacter radicis]|uniref:HNH endonuclease n=1 Tax=Ancylobacter radicis TaxID=2836179 RepID=A0ABS5R3E9_9HYPH|nr:HNH endonuclease [Ancylobacter radicis]MBS9476183.1 HNH endonuclease [Ancylobacter radicis]
MRGKHGHHVTASRQHRWKPGSRVGSTGHVKVRVGRSHPLADPNGWAYEHLVVWCAAGRPRPGRGEVLHHLNEDKTDNRIENLHLMTKSEHNALHLRNRPRCPETGRLLDGVEHNALPEVRS